jgi:hypothetical protein
LAPKILRNFLCQELGVLAGRHLVHRPADDCESPPGCNNVQTARNDIGTSVQQSDELRRILSENPQRRYRRCEPLQLADTPGMRAQSETEIVNPECVDISFPGFWDAIKSSVT